MMRWKDGLCVLCLFAASTATIQALLASGGPCTGYATACQITPYPLGPEGSACCKNQASIKQRYLSFGTGGFLYKEDAVNECGDTGLVKKMGSTLFCTNVISYNNCGGKVALVSCTP